MNVTYQELIENPEILRAIEVAARRERAKAVRELIVEPVQRALRTDHAPRAQLARQG